MHANFYHLLQSRKEGGDGGQRELTSHLLALVKTLVLFNYREFKKEGGGSGFNTVLL